MKEIAESENQRLSSRPDFQRKPRHMDATRPNPCSETNHSQAMFADIIALLAVILLKQGYDSLRLRELALGSQ